MAFFAFVPLSAPARAESLGAWSTGSQYPNVGPPPNTGIQWDSCVVYNGVMYCVGGGNYDSGDSSNVVEYAQVSGSGISPWQQSTDYPLVIQDESCVTSGGYIYCIGGFTPTSPTSASSTDMVYFAQLSSSGVGQWSSTTSYPFPASSLSCAADSGYVYCVGGFTYGQSEAADQVYFAQLTSSGIGHWSAGTPYPIAVSAESCAASSGTMVCVGGTLSSGTSSTSSVYFAPVSASGVGTWSSTNQYPTSITEETCVASSGYLYCIAGMDLTYEYDRNAVYYAQVTSSGLGPWFGTSAYPLNADSFSCGTASGYIFCVGGEGQSLATFYSQILQNLATTTTATQGVANGWTRASDYPTPIQSEECVSDSGYVYCIGGDVNNGGTSGSGGVNPEGTNASYFGSPSATGITWQSTTPYPGSAPQSCFASTGYVYCVAYRNSFFAQLSSSGIGTWSPTTRYPMDLTGFSCASSSGYAYCVGGTFINSQTSYESNLVYYAPLSGTGIGTWTQTASFPILSSGAFCTGESGHVYCLGGNLGSGAYFADVSSTGVGTWSQTTGDPFATSGEVCADATGTVFCVGGAQGSIFQDEVEYAPLTSSGVGGWTGTTSYPIDVNMLGCSAASGFLLCAGGVFGETQLFQSNPPTINETFIASLSQLTVSAQGSGTTTSTSTTSTTTSILIGGSQYGADLVDDVYDPHNGMVYIASATSPGQVFVLDPSTDSIVGNVTVGSGASALAFDPQNNDIYVAIDGSLVVPGNVVTVISDSNNQVVGNVTVGNLPEAMAFDQQNGKVYVTNGEDNTVSIIDGATNTVVQTVGVGEGPLGLAADPATGDVFVANQFNDSVTVIGGSDGAVKATLSVGSSPQYVVYDPQSQDILVTYLGISGGGITVIHGSTESVAETVQLNVPLFKAVYAQATGDVYATDLQTSNVTVIDPSSASAVATLVAGENSNGIAYDPTNLRLYVTGTTDQSVVVLQLQGAGQSTTTTQVGSSTTGSAVSTSATSTGSTSSSSGQTTSSTNQSQTSSETGGVSPSSGGFPLTYALAGVGALVLLLLLFLLVKRSRKKDERPPGPDPKAIV